MRKLRVALVHDWLTGMRGGEKVLEALCELFPGAHLYTLLWLKGSVSETIEKHVIFQSAMRYMPLASSKYRYYLPIMPLLIERFKLDGYDLIISSSHCVAKGVRVKDKTIHICYCHTPMRYIWDMYDEYFGYGRSGLITGSIMRLLRPYLQKWDVRTSTGVSHFIANSDNVRKRIKKYYDRESDVIYPPVDVEGYGVNSDGNGSYLIVSAFAPYKRVDLAVEAFNKTGLPLRIIGRGQMEKRLHRCAASNIKFLGWVDKDMLKKEYASCKALIFPGEEDFGIVPVEALAAGKPVIAFARGGALETVREGISGIFFPEQTPDSLNEAVFRLDTMNLDPVGIRGEAVKFSHSRFMREMKDFMKTRIFGKIEKENDRYAGH